MRERLYRSRKDKMVAGVAGGLAEYFDIDPVIVRIVFIAAALLTGTGFIVYALLWMVVPYKDEVQNPVTEPAAEGATTETGEPVTGEPIVNNYENRTRRRGHVAGYILIAIGCLFLADRFIPHFDAEEFWPLLVIALGVGLLIKGSKK